MKELPSSFPRKAMNSAAELLGIKRIVPGIYISLRISIENKNINLRDLSAYLSFIDSVYGRSTPKGIYHYAHNPSEQLRIKSFERGSLEAEIIKLITNTKEIYPFILLYLSLKCLPSVMTAYKDYEEGRLNREKRKLIKQKLCNETNLIEMQNRYLNQLVRLLDHLYSFEYRKLNSAKRFAQNSEKQLELKFKNGIGDNDST